MSRKPFISFLSVLFSLVALSARGQEPGLQLYSLRNEFSKDVPATMAKVREMGFRNVEMTETYGLSFPEFIKLLAVNGLNVVSIGTEFETLEKFPQQVADEARSYGAKFVVVYWIPHEDTFDKQDADRAIKVMNTAGNILAKNGLMLCYHPHGYEFSPFEKGTLFDYLVHGFDNRYVHFQMDVFWVRQAGQDPLALLKKYPTRFVMMHLKDRKKGTPFSSDGKAPDETSVVLGTGDVNIAGIVKAARELGITQLFIEDESPDALKQIPLSLEYLRSLHPEPVGKAQVRK